MKPTADPVYDEYRNFAFHPYNVMLILLLFGISALFLAFSGAFIYNRIQSQLPPIRLPGLFILNTLILIGSSASLMWAKRSYLRDDTRKYQQALWLTLVLSVVFLIAQFFAWRELFTQDIFIHTDNSASYLYVISGLHFAHVIAGIPFLIGFISTAYTRMRDPVSVLVYFSDPDKRLRLRLLSIYWHFLDGLWIYLVIFFWINYLIRG